MTARKVLTGGIMKFKKGDRVKILNNVIQLILKNKMRDAKYPIGTYAMEIPMRDLELALRAKHVISSGYKTPSYEIYKVKTLYTNLYYDNVLNYFSFTSEYIIADKETTMDRWNKYIRRK